MGRLVAQAAELDALCAEFDVQITLTLEAQGGPMDGAVVTAAAEDAGFVASLPGRWTKRDGQGRLLSTLTATSLLAGPARADASTFRSRRVIATRSRRSSPPRTSSRRA